jgi:hypothetical protein
VHSAERHDGLYGISAFVSPAVARGRTFYYFDPIRSLGDEAILRELTGRDGLRTLDRRGTVRSAPHERRVGLG